MKKRELKNQIRQALTSDAPDLRSKILASCREESQYPSPESISYSEPKKSSWPRLRFAMKGVAAAALCLMLFVSGISTGYFIRKDSSLPTTDGIAETFVYLDVNPSIELQLDKSKTVISCIAANEDAEIILDGLELSGTNMNTALTAIIGSMYVNGYLSEDSNSILISVNGDNSEGEETLLSDITGKVDEVLEGSNIDCSIIAQSISVDDALKDKAKKNGVSVGKMKFVEKMVEALEDYEDEDSAALASMSIRELNLIYSTRPDKNNEKDPFCKDISKGEVSGFVSTNDAWSKLMESIDVDPDTVESYKIRANTKNNGHSHKVIYTLEIKLKGDDTVYKYTVDCISGEVESFDDRIPIRNGSNDQSSDPNSSHGGAPGELPDKNHDDFTETPPNDEHGDAHAAGK